MINMFKNYDNMCCHDVCRLTTEIPEIMLGWSGAEILFDQKGNEVGLGFNHKSPINLVFNISGCVTDDFGEDIDVDDFINSNELNFELLNFRHQPVYSNVIDGHIEDGMLSIKLNQEVVDNLVPEIYYIRLTLNTESETYVLFTQKDGLIHIS